MMTDLSVVERVARLPLDYRRRKNISMRDLVAESGYPASPESVTFNALAEAFEAHPELIDAWVLESVDTRAPGYPWLKPPDSEQSCWIVGPSAGAPRELWESFHSGAQACAAYVMRYLRMVG